MTDWKSEITQDRPAQWQRVAPDKYIQRKDITRKAEKDEIGNEVFVYEAKVRFMNESEYAEQKTLADMQDKIDSQDAAMAEIQCNMEYLVCMSNLEV